MGKDFVCPPPPEVTRSKVNVNDKGLYTGFNMTYNSFISGKSIRKSLSLDSPVSDILISPVSDSAELPEFPPTSLTDCEMCETQAPSR